MYYFRRTRSQIAIHYKEHPHIDYIRLEGTVNYANLCFTPTENEAPPIIPDEETRLARINDRMFNFARPIDESPSELEFILDYRSVLHETEHVKFVDLYRCVLEYSKFLRCMNKLSKIRSFITLDQRTSRMSGRSRILQITTIFCIFVMMREM